MYKVSEFIEFAEIHSLKVFIIVSFVCKRLPAADLPYFAGFIIFAEFANSTYFRKYTAARGFVKSMKFPASKKSQISNADVKSA